MQMFTVTFALILFTVASARTRAQTVQEKSPVNSAVTTVTFTLSETNANPSYYLVALSSMGSLHYKSIPDSDRQTGAPYTMEFTASRATRAQVFRLVERVHFFVGNLRTSRTLHPETGSKSLVYSDGHNRNEVFYTFSKNSSVNRLTRIFESIASTMEFGRKLQQLRTGPPPALLAELKQLDLQARHGKLREFHSIAPIVRQIAADPSVPRNSRSLAQNILSREHEPAT
jgi:hypothetical protein